MVIKNNWNIRTTDDVGRIVLPVKWRKSLDLEDGDEVIISTQGQYIVIEKVEPCCIFCGSRKNIKYKSEKLICKKCVEEIQKL